MDHRLVRKQGGGALEASPGSRWVGQLKQIAQVKADESVIRRQPKRASIGVERFAELSLLEIRAAQALVQLRVVRALFQQGKDVVGQFRFHYPSRPLIGTVVGSLGCVPQPGEQAFFPGTDQRRTLDKRLI